MPEPDASAARVLEDGFAILERAIEPALIEQLTAAVDRCMEALGVPFGPNDFLGTRTLWHGGGANRSAARRLAIICNYCAGFLRQEECQLLALPREQVAGFPPRLQALVGYGTYRGLLGHVDQRSPGEWVDPGASTDMVWRRIRR